MTELQPEMGTSVVERLRRLATGLFVHSGRSTITGMLRGAAREQYDWSSDYRFFSRRRVEPKHMFGLVEEHLLKRLQPDQDVVAALDDTKYHKTGTKIPGVSYQRDPMSPPFHTYFIRAQRFSQISMLMPLDTNAPAAARAFPICLRHVPPPPRPGSNASEETLAAFRALQKIQNLSVAGSEMIRECRADLDARGASERTLIMSVDGSYTNETVLRNLPERTTLIGRIRKDAKFFHPPTQPSDAQSVRGRPRKYGELAPTPQALLKDESVPWTSVRIWAAGKFHDCDYKTIENLQWAKAGPLARLRLIVIRPIGYRLSAQSRLLYRQPAFLICTDQALPIQTAIQDYFWRWDIEVNHRDEKQLFGIGQAQVRSEHSVQLVPAFIAASYSMLLLASAELHGFDASYPTIPVPRWLRHKVSKQTRLTTGQILEEMRQSHAQPPVPGPAPDFDHFEDHIARHLKCPKSSISREQAIASVMQ